MFCHLICRVSYNVLSPMCRLSYTSFFHVDWISWSEGKVMDW